MKRSTLYRRYRSVTTAFATWLGQRCAWKGPTCTGNSHELRTAGPMVLRTAFVSRLDFRRHNLVMHVASYLQVNVTAQWWFPLHRQLAVLAPRISATQQSIAYQSQVSVRHANHTFIWSRVLRSNQYKVTSSSSTAITKVKNEQYRISPLTLVDSRSHGSYAWKIWSHDVSSLFSWSSPERSGDTTNAYVSMTHPQTRVLSQFLTKSAHFRDATTLHEFSNMHSMVRQSFLQKTSVGTVVCHQQSSLAFRTAVARVSQPGAARQRVDKVEAHAHVNSTGRLTSTTVTKESPLTLLQTSPVIHRIVARSSTVEQDLRNTTWLYRRDDAIRSAAVIGQVQRQQIAQEEMVKFVRRTITQECDNLEKRITRQGSLAAVELTDQVYVQLVRRLQVEKERLGR